MKISKSQNANYGSAFEQAIVNIINSGYDFHLPLSDGDYESIDAEAYSYGSNGEGCSLREFDLPDGEDIWEIYHDAQYAVQEIEYYGLSVEYGAIRVGQHTSTESCDVKLADGTELEIKYVGTEGSRGTYYNTSLEKVAEYFGYEAYNDFLYAGGYHDYLAEAFEGSGYKVNSLGNSPVSRKASSWFRHNAEDDYENVRSLEYSLRAEWVRGFCDYLIETGNSGDFIKMALDKSFSDYKHMPSMFLVYTRGRNGNDSCEIFSEKDIQAMAGNGNDISQEGECSIVFGNVAAVFSWQNGVGLNNPTMRVFLR